LTNGFFMKFWGHRGGTMTTETKRKRDDTAALLERHKITDWQPVLADLRVMAKRYLGSRSMTSICRMRQLSMSSINRALNDDRILKPGYIRHLLALMGWKDAAFARFLRGRKCRGQ
jgi:hypothetical protein